MEGVASVVGGADAGRDGEVVSGCELASKRRFERAFEVDVEFAFGKIVDERLHFGIHALKR